MSPPSKEQVKSAIDRFFKESNDRKGWFEKQVKGLSKLCLATHISKGVHSGSKGDDILFSKEEQNKRCHGYVGTHSIDSQLLDITADNNAAKMPLMRFLDFSVTDDGSYRIRDMIVNFPDYFKDILEDDAEKSSCEQLINVYLSVLSQQSRTHTNNKQVLWPIDPEDDNYRVLVPLYPSVLSYELYQNIQDRQRRVEQVKQARENRKKTRVIDTAVVKLGGTQPQNISFLNSKQAGQQWLLPSLPPRFVSRGFSLSKHSKSLFSSFAYRVRMRAMIEGLLKIFNIKPNNKAIREARDNIIAKMLVDTFYIATELQARPAGWSADYALSESQKIWLDPRGERSQQLRAINSEWKDEIAEQFALWLQSALKNAVKSAHKIKASDFADPEFHHWKRLIDEAIEVSQRLGDGVFE